MGARLIIFCYFLVISNIAHGGLQNDDSTVGVDSVDKTFTSPEPIIIPGTPTLVCFPQSTFPPSDQPTRMQTTTASGEKNILISSTAAPGLGATGVIDNSQSTLSRKTMLNSASTNKTATTEAIPSETNMMEPGEMHKITGPTKSTAHRGGKTGTFTTSTTHILPRYSPENLTKSKLANTPVERTIPTVETFVMPSSTYKASVTTYTDQHPVTSSKTPPPVAVDLTHPPSVEQLGVSTPSDKQSPPGGRTGQQTPPPLVTPSVGQSGVSTPSDIQTPPGGRTGQQTPPPLVTPSVGQPRVSTPSDIQTPPAGRTGQQTPPPLVTPSVGQPGVTTPSDIQTPPGGRTGQQTPPPLVTPSVGQPGVTTPSDIQTPPGGRTGQQTPPPLVTPSVGQPGVTTPSDIQTPPGGRTGQQTPPPLVTQSVGQPGVTTPSDIQTPPGGRTGQQTPPPLVTPSVGQPGVTTPSDIQTPPGGRTGQQTPPPLVTPSVGQPGVTTPSDIQTPPGGRTGQETPPPLVTPSVGQPGVTTPSDIQTPPGGRTGQETPPALVTPTVGQLGVTTPSDIQTPPGGRTGQQTPPPLVTPSVGQPGASTPSDIQTPPGGRTGQKTPPPLVTPSVGQLGVTTPSDIQTPPGGRTGQQTPPPLVTPSVGQPGVSTPSDIQTPPGGRTGQQTPPPLVTPSVGQPGVSTPSDIQTPPGGRTGQQTPPPLVTPSVGQPRVSTPSDIQTPPGGRTGQQTPPPLVTPSVGQPRVTTPSDIQTPPGGRTGQHTPPPLVTLSTSQPGLTAHPNGETPPQTPIPPVTTSREQPVVSGRSTPPQNLTSLLTRSTRLPRVSTPPDGRVAPQMPVSPSKTPSDGQPRPQTSPDPTQQERTTFQTGTTSFPSTPVPIDVTRVAVSTTPSASRPEAATLSPPVIPDSDVCDNCVFENGVGYNPHPTQCDMFYQCLSTGDRLQPVLKKCQFGLFWNHEVLTCTYPTLVHCPQDPCLLSSQGHRDTCRGYWVCGWGRRTELAQCCPNGQAYSPGEGCVQSLCSDSCPIVIKLDERECNRREYTPNQRMYFEDISPQKAILRQCAPGSAFDGNECHCSIRIPFTPPRETCKRILYLPFDKDFKDHSGRHIPVKVEGVTLVKIISTDVIGGGAALLDGNDRIVMWYFSNRDFGNTFTIRFNYRELGGKLSTDKPEALVTNANCEGDCSLAVSFNRTSRATTARIATDVQGNIYLGASHGVGWKSVEVRYNGTVLSIKVDGIVETIPARGDLLKVQAALQIGHGCTLFSRFRGYIDEFEYFNCLP